MLIMPVKYDLTVKLLAYEKAGMPEYSIIDLGARTLALYRLQADGTYAAPLTYAESDTAAFARLPSLPFRVGVLFEGAPDTTL